YGSRGYYEAEKDDLSVTLGGKYQSDNVMSELQVTAQKQKSWNYEQAKGKHSGTEDELEQQNVQWTNSYLLNNNTTFAGGIDWRNESNNTTLAGGIDWRNESYKDKSANKTFDRTNGALFGMATTSIDKAMLEGSARLDDNEEYGSEFTYSLAAGYQFVPEFGVKASFGTAFKAPNLYQQYDPTYGEKDLKP
ncbi:TonB-dependent receptor, partial [Vibrio parahaemolyticus]|nr:TonB-dependent receptor [Vibrio parahaemolyticus]